MRIHAFVIDKAFEQKTEIKTSQHVAIRAQKMDFVVISNEL